MKKKPTFPLNVQPRCTTTLRSVQTSLATYSVDSFELTREEGYKDEFIEREEKRREERDFKHQQSSVCMDTGRR